MRSEDLSRHAVRVAGALVLAGFAIALARPAAAQPGTVILNGPVNGQTFAPGDQVLVAGNVMEFDGTPVVNVTVWVRLVDADGVSLQQIPTTSRSPDGGFSIGLPIPQEAVPGTYQIIASASDPQIANGEVEVQVRASTTGGLVPAGVPAFLWVVTPIGGALAAVVGGAWVRRRARMRRQAEPFGSPKP